MEATFVLGKESSGLCCLFLLLCSIEKQADLAWDNYLPISSEVGAFLCYLHLLAFQPAILVKKKMFIF